MNNIGKLGEEVASKYLEAKGYRIRERNYRTFLGEIDIISEYKKIIKNALNYLAKYRLWQTDTRFDVILVSISNHKSVNRIKHIENAFSIDFSSGFF